MIFVLYYLMIKKIREQNIVLLLPMIVTLNTVFVSGFIDLDTSGLFMSNSVSLREGGKTKSSGLPTSHWCRKCSSDSFSLEDTVQVHLNLVNQHYVKYTYATTAARKLNIGNISKGPSLREFFLCFTSIAGIVI